MRVFLSLGAGVQSTTVYLMACDGMLDSTPEAAIFADTGWEPKEVYRRLEWLKKVGSIPIHVVSAGNIRDDTIKNATNGSRFASIPFRGLSLEGSEMMLRRQCTREYKVTPITKELRRLLGYQPHQRIKDHITLLIGISKDEVTRCKPNRERWITNSWPLIDLMMSRENCKQWLRDRGYPEPPKSACIGCPYHDDAMWRDMKENHTADFADAVNFEWAVHDGLKDVKGKVYLHRSLRFLDEVDFRNMEDLGQTNLFENECEGYCGI